MTSRIEYLLWGGLAVFLLVVGCLAWPHLPNQLWIALSGHPQRETQDEEEDSPLVFSIRNGLSGPATLSNSSDIEVIEHVIDRDNTYEHVWILVHENAEWQVIFAYRDLDDKTYSGQLASAWHIPQFDFYMAENHLPPRHPYHAAFDHRPTKQEIQEYIDYSKEYDLSINN